MRVFSLFCYLACFSFTVPALGQTYLATYTTDGGNPAGLNAEVDTETAGWTPVLAANAAANAWSATQTLPFAVTFFGTGYTDFLVSYHGVLTFTTAPTPALPGDNATLPAATLPDLSIAAFWDAFTDDAPMGANDQVLTKTFGTAPNRQHWVKWNDIEYGSPAGTGNSTFAIVFDEASGDIYLVDMASDNAANSSVTAGLQASVTCAAAYGDATLALAGNAITSPDNDYLTFTAETLSGTYTVGGVNPDFLTLANAAAALGCGIGGPVQLALRDGTYQEQLSLPAIAGSSATDTVLIASESGDSSAVIISWPPSEGSNYTLYLNGTDHLTLQGLTLQRSGSGSKADSRVLWLDNEANHNRITHCRLIGTDTASNENRELVYLFNTDAIDLEISQTAFLNGDEGIFLQASNLYTTTGVAVHNNTFEGQYHRGISVQYLVAMDIRDNQLSSSSANVDYQAIRMLSGQDAFAVVNNQISTPAYGLYVQTHTLASVGHPLVANNLVNGGNQAGLYLRDADSLDLYHNTVVVNNSFNPALQVVNAGAGYQLVNNVLVNEGFGPLLRLGNLLATTVFERSDYNDWFSEGAIQAEQNSVSYADLCAWQAATGLDAASQDKDPLIQTSGSYDAASPFLLAGTPLAAVGSDLLGNARSLTAPSMGAYEIPAPSGDPLAGTYVIGACQDFHDFSEAALALATFGVSGAVVFEVEAGTYVEQVSFNGAAGASGATPVTFRSQSGDSADVWLTWPASASAADNYVLQVDGIDHVVFEDLSVRRTGGDTYAVVIDLRGDADSLTFNRVHVVGGTSGTVAANVLQADGQDVDSLTVSNSTFSGGGYGLYLAGVSLAAPQQGHLLSNNQLSGHALGGIWLVAQTASTVASNQLTLDVEGDGLHLQSSNGAHQLTGNLLQLNAGGRALVLTDVVGSTGQETLLANNWVLIDGNGVDRSGIAVTGNSDVTRVYHNSVLLSGDALANRDAYYTNATGTDHSVLNNIFVNLASGFAIFCANATGLGTSNYNNLYNNANPIGHVNGADYNDLTAWQIGTTNDANSLSLDPMFASTTDLQVAAVELNDAGTALAAVSTDYQQEARDPSTPDIGADEFTPAIYTLVNDACVTADDIVSTGSGEWQYIYAGRQLVAAINDNGNTLGTVSTEVYVNTGLVRQAPGSSRYLDRNWSINIAGTITSGTVSTRLYYLDSELTDLILADPTVTSAANLGCTRYSGNNQNCEFNDNQAGTGFYHFYPSPDVVDQVVFGGEHLAEVAIEAFSEFYLTGNGVVLPVAGLNLSATQQGRANQLDWSVAQAQNLSHFEVLRATDGTTFTQIGRVTAPDATLTDAQFAYRDADAWTPGITTVWYRLRSVDLDGQVQLSPKVQVAMVAAAPVCTLMPNPSHGACVLRFQGPTPDPIQVTVSDALGRVIHQQAYPVNQQQRIDLAVSQWPQGIYWVEVRQGGARWRQPLIVE
jgi:hypothetical protein